MICATNGMAIELLGVLACSCFRVRRVALWIEAALHVVGCARAKIDVVILPVILMAIRVVLTGPVFLVMRSAVGIVFSIQRSYEAGTFQWKVRLCIRHQMNRYLQMKVWKHSLPPKTR